MKQRRPRQHYQQIKHSKKRKRKRSKTLWVELRTMSLQRFSLGILTIGKKLDNLSEKNLTTMIAAMRYKRSQRRPRNNPQRKDNSFWTLKR